MSACAALRRLPARRHGQHARARCVPAAVDASPSGSSAALMTRSGAATPGGKRNAVATRPSGLGPPGHRRRADGAAVELSEPGNGRWRPPCREQCTSGQRPSQQLAGPSMPGERACQPRDARIEPEMPHAGVAHGVAVQRHETGRLRPRRNRHDRAQEDQAGPMQRVLRGGASMPRNEDPDKAVGGELVSCVGDGPPQPCRPELAVPWRDDHQVRVRRFCAVVSWCKGAEREPAPGSTARMPEVELEMRSDGARR
jgi:hypothetical protein